MIKHTSRSLALIVAILISLHAFGQGKLPIDGLKPNEQLPAYITTDLGTGMPDQLLVPLAINGKILTLHLDKHTNRGPNFEVLLHRADGSFEPYNPGPVNTYFGTVMEDPSVMVGAVLTDAGMVAQLVTTQNEEYRIAPALQGANVVARHNHQPQYSITKQGNDYDESLHMPSLEVNSSEEKRTASRHEHQHQLRAAGNETVKQAEIGFDIAYSAYKNRYGSNTADVNNNINEFVNSTMNTIWIRDVMVEHVIGKVVIRTSANSCPYEKAGNLKVTNATLNQFRNLWNSGQHGNSHDLASLHVGGGGGGLAWVGTVNESYKYSLSDGGNKHAWRGYNRHEVGHTWGLNHSHGRREINPNGQQYGIMWSGPHDRATTDEAITMIAERNSSGLRDIGPFRNRQIPPYGKRDGATIGQGQRALVNVLANDYDANRNPLSLASYDARSVKGAHIKRIGENLEYLANAGAGEDRFYYRVGDGTGRTNWGVVYVNVVPSITVDLNATAYNYDLGTAGSPVRGGWTRISPFTSGDISWSGSVNSVDRGTRNGVNEINQDLVYARNRITLRHKIRNGNWKVVMNMGDADYNHDRMYVRVEGKTIGNNVSNTKGQFPYVTGDVNVTDGRLDIEVWDAGGNDVNWVWNRLSISKNNGREAMAIEKQQPLVYPNPSSGVFHVSLAEYDGQPVQIEILTLAGKSIKWIDLQQTHASTATLPLETLDKGTYLLRIGASNGTNQYARIVIE